MGKKDKNRICLLVNQKYLSTIPKGVTLVELIVTISIMAIIITPFIATSVNSSENNAYAEDKMKAHSLANVVTEKIKMNRNFMNENAGSLIGTDEDGYMVYSDNDDPEIVIDDNIIVKYKIERKYQEALSYPEGDSRIYSSFTNEQFESMNYHVEIDVEGGLISFDDENSYDLSEEYELVINVENDEYSCSISNNPEIIDNIPFNNIEDYINIGIKFLDELVTPLKIKLNVDDVPVDKYVRVFAIGKDIAERLQITNSGDNKLFDVYDNLDSEPINEYTNELYEIDVKVEIDGEVIDGMVSYVKI